MRKSRALPPTPWRRRAAFWSIPVLAAALGLSAAPWAHAQNDAGTRAPSPAAPGSTGPGGAVDASRTAAPSNAATSGAPAAASRDMRLSQLIGMDVRNPQGENLGEIQDVIVDVNNQRVHYAVLSFGGFLGMGEKLFAYPVRLLRQSADREELVLNVERDRLRESPGFERNRAPNWNDERYRSEVERYHGGGVAVRPRENMRLVRASELLERDINDLNGNDAGEVEDIVVNLGSGRVRYVVMDFDQAWNPNDKLLALPMTAFDVPSRDDVDLRLRVSRRQLDMAHAFNARQWPDVNDPAWQRNNERWLGRLGERRDGRDAAGER